MDYVVHFWLEAVGGFGCTCAQRYCRRRLHQVLVWGVFSIVSTVVTVHLVG